MNFEIIKKKFYFRAAVDIPKILAKLNTKIDPETNTAKFINPITIIPVDSTSNSFLNSSAQVEYFTIREEQLILLCTLTLLGCHGKNNIYFEIPLFSLNMSSLCNFYHAIFKQFINQKEELEDTEPKVLDDTLFTFLKEQHSFHQQTLIFPYIIYLDEYLVYLQKIQFEYNIDYLTEKDSLNIDEIEVVAAEQTIEYIEEMTRILTRAKKEFMTFDQYVNNKLDLK